MCLFGVGVGHAICANDPAIAGIACSLTHTIPWLHSGVGVVLGGDSVFVFKVVAEFALGFHMEGDVLGVSAMLETC